MELFSIEFWVGFQMMVLVIIVFLNVFYIKRMKTGVEEEVTRQTMEEVIHIIEPLIREAKDTANLFDSQIREKSNLIKKLNGKLDSRIISLNLLLTRSETKLRSFDDISPSNNNHVYDQQESILSMYEKGETSEQIAQKLSMPKGEVDLVINLKKKFVSVD